MKINPKTAQKGSTLVIVTMILMILSVVSIKAISVATMSSMYAIESVAIRELDSQMNGTLYHLINPVSESNESIAISPRLSNGRENPSYLPYFVTSNSPSKLTGFRYTGIDHSENPSSIYFENGIFHTLKQPRNLNVEQKACRSYGSLRMFSPNKTTNPAYVTWVGDAPNFNNFNNSCTLATIRGQKQANSILVGIFHEYGLTPYQISGGLRTETNFDPTDPLSPSVFTVTAVGTLLSVSTPERSYSEKITECATNRVTNNVYFPTDVPPENRQTIYECLVDVDVTTKQLSSTFIHEL